MKKTTKNTILLTLSNAMIFGGAFVLGFITKSSKSNKTVDSKDESMFDENIRELERLIDTSAELAEDIDLSMKIFDKKIEKCNELESYIKELNDNDSEKDSKITELKNLIDESVKNMDDINTQVTVFDENLKKIDEIKSAVSGK